MRTTIGDVDDQGLLVPAQGAEVWHGPVEADQAQKTLDESSRLSKRHAEQNLHRQACLDRGVNVLRRLASLACRRWCPAHVQIETDRQGTALLERVAVGWPFLGLVARRYGSARTPALSRWSRKMNPPRCLRNKVARIPRRSRNVVAAERKDRSMVHPAPEGTKAGLANKLPCNICGC